jgi:hypothetical protein
MVVIISNKEHGKAIINLEEENATIAVAVMKYFLWDHAKLQKNTK